MKKALRFRTNNQDALNRRVFPKLKSNKSADNRRHTGLRYRLVQVICMVLISSILTVSVPAAPGYVVNSAGEMKQDMRFFLLANGFFDYFSNFGNVLAFATGSTQTQIAIQEIKIFPDTDSIAEGEQIVFSAVAYDGNGDSISGVNFTWTVQDTGRNSRVRALRNAHFKPRIFGTYLIKVSAEGQEAEKSITVTENDVEELFRQSEENIKKGKDSQVKAVSPRSAKAINQKDDIKSAENVKRENFSTPESLELPEDGGWNNGNYGSSIEPGNLPGNTPGQPADDGAGNGNFQLSAPVVSLPGRGIDLALSLNYNSRLWNKSGTELTYDIDRGFPGPGWSLGFGKIMDMGSGGGSMIVDADGTRRAYSGGITTNYGGSSSFNGYTTDGSFIDYTSQRNATEITSAQAQLPNGSIISYGAKGNGAVYPIFIQDANGNYINITYRNNEGPNLETVTDTMGRVINFQYDSLGRLISVTAPRSRNQGIQYGNERTRTLVQFQYTSLQLSYSFVGGNTAVVRKNPVDVLRAIYYPATNTGYWFGDSDSYSSYGMLAKVVEQRGMSWQTSAEEQGIINAGQMTKQAAYNYPLSAANETGRTNGINLSDAPTYETLTESWDGRDVNQDSITTYAIDNNTSHDDGTSNSPARSIRIMQPNGVVNQQFSYRTPNSWTDGLVFADLTYIPDTNGMITFSGISGTYTLISKSNVSWQQGNINDYDAPRPGNTIVTEVINGSEQKITTTYDYTGGKFNQVVRSCDYDNGGAKMRCAVNQYNNSSNYIGQRFYTTGGVYNGYAGRHIYGLVTATGVENPDTTIASWTKYEYDGGGLADTPGIIQHADSHNPNNSGTQQICYWICPGTCNYRSGNGDNPDAPIPCQCPEEEVCDTYPVFNSATNARGNVTKITSYADAQNQTGEIVETRNYDITGNTIAASSSCCQQTSFQFTLSTQYAYPVSQTRGSSDPNSPDRITTTAAYLYETGLVSQTTDANGRTSYSSYHPDTLRLMRATASTGAYSAYAYDDTAMTITEEVHEAGDNLAGKSIKYLNGVGQVKREESLRANGVYDIAETKYDKLGRVWKQSRPFRAGDTVQWSETIYDAQGRTEKVIEPDGSYSRAFYNESSRPDAASNLIGNTIRVVDAWGRERWGRYDQQGRLAEVVEPNPNGNGSVLSTGSLVTKYSYNTLGKLLQTEQGSQFRNFKYDSLGRLTRQKLAEQTATLNDAGNYVGANQTGAQWSESFIYDERSNVTQKTDVRGVKTNFVYGDTTTGASDPLNRLRTMNYDLSGAHDTSKPINAALNVTYDYMTSGDLERIKKIESAGLAKEEYSYDPEGRVQHYTQTVSARENYPMTVSYIYDSLSRIKEVHYPAQYGQTGSPRKIVEHTYDVASRLSILKYDGTQQAGDIIYDAADQTTSIKIGAAGTNQVTESYQFDPQTGLLTNQKIERGTGTLLDLSYDYNRNNSVGNLNGKTGHLTKITDNLNNNKNREYEYDALGRLTKAKGGTNSLWTQNYSYDRYGNRESVTASGVAVDNTTIPRDGIAALSYDVPSNRITTAGFEYDVAGNQTRALAEDAQTWIRMEYDYAGRLSVVKKDDGTALQAFQYAPSGSRLMNYDYLSGEFILYANLGGTTLAEYREYTSAVPTWTKSYTYLGDGLLSTVTPNGQGGENIEFNHPDRLGTRVMTNQATGAASDQTTLPFGTALNAESSLTNNNKRFTSYDRSARTGLDYAVNRTYDSKQGRFTTVDPIRMGASSLASPQSLNLYTYCGNDPINHTDPSGLFFGSLFKWIGKKLWGFAKKVFYAAVKAAITAAFTFVTSGGNIAAAIGVFIGAFIANLAFPKFGNYLTPTWNPDLRHPLSGNSGLNRYIIQNLTGPKTRAYCAKLLPIINDIRPIIDQIWKASNYGTNAQEQGGLIGFKPGSGYFGVAYPLSSADSNISLRYLRYWSSQIINNPRKSGYERPQDQTYYSFLIHTHPFDTGQEVTNSRTGEKSKAANVEKPSGGDIDSLHSGLTGIVVTKGFINVFSSVGRRCHFSR